MIARTTRWIVAATFLVVGPGTAFAHLGVAQTSLPALLAGADGVLVARADAATDERGRTAFHRVTPIAGLVPEDRFDQTSPEPILRYRDGELAIVIVRCADATAGPGPAPVVPCRSWTSLQPAGSGFTIERAEDVARIAAVVRSLWLAVHSADETSRERAATDALVGALDVPARKLRYSAALDLLRIAHHPGSFSLAARKTLAAYGNRPDDDPALRPIVASLVQTIDQADRDGGAR